jgi:antirestriction protein ArdC
VRRGEHGTKVYFVKQLLVKEDESGETETHVIPMLREYTVVNVDQCDGLGVRRIFAAGTARRRE